MTESKRPQSASDSTTQAEPPFASKETQADLAWAGYLIYLCSVLLGAWAVCALFSWVGNR